MSKKRFTEEEHVEVGQKLTNILAELQRIKVQVGNSYPYSSKFYRSLDRTITALGEARSEGDNESAKEFDQPPWSPGWYYGKSDDVV